MKRNTLIIVAVFVVLLLIVLVGENPFGGREKPEAPPLYPGLDSSQVAVVEVMTQTDTTRLEKADGIWRVATEGGYAADPKAVGDLIARVRDIKKEEVASRNPEKRSIYQVDGSLIRATLMGPGDESLADLYVGKSGPSYSGSYVRAEGSDEVVLVGGYIRGVFDKGSRGWRDRTIFEFDPAAMLRMTIQRADTVVNITTSDKIRWYMDDPDTSEVKFSLLENLQRTVSALKADDFDPEVSLEDAGLDEPWGSFSVHLEDGTDRVLLVGAEESGSRWVKRPDKDMIFKLRSFRIETLFPNVENLKAPEPEPAPAEPAGPAE